METVAQIMVGVRRLLRGVSDVKLSDDSIRAELRDLCVQYRQQESLSLRERETDVTDITLTEAPIDYNVNAGQLEDFEEERLEMSIASASAQDHWYEVVIVPLSTWAAHFNEGYAAASFYGSSDRCSPAKVRLNLTPEQVGGRLWRLTYREPLVTAMQRGDRPPLATGHLPMLKREAAMLLMPQVMDDSLEWVEWMGRTLPIYQGKLVEQKADWRNYLTSSVEPQEQPIPRSDRYGSRRRAIRPYVPAQ
jgi:hypothetical protein